MGDNGPGAAGPECGIAELLPFGYDSEPLTGVCSSHGTCAQGTCVCQDGWTGRSDFINTEGLDCQINELVIKVLWGVALAVILGCAVAALPKVKLRLQQHRDLKNVNAAKGRKFGLRQNRGLLAVLAFNVVCLPAMLMYGVWRLADPSQRLGITVPATVLFAVARIGFYGMVSSFQPALLSSFLQGSRRNRMTTKTLVRASNAFAAINMFLVTLCALIPLVTLVDGGRTEGLAVAVYMAYMGATTFTLVLYFLQAVYLYRKANKLLEHSHALTKDDRVLRIKERIASSQVEGMRQSIGQAVVYLVFLCWPFLYNKHDYLLPIGWIAYPLVYRRIANTIIASEPGSSSGVALGSSSAAARRAKRTGGTDGDDADVPPRSSYVGSTDIGTPLDTSQSPSPLVSSFSLSLHAKRALPTPELQVDAPPPTAAAESILANSFRDGVSSFYDEHDSTDGEDASDAEV